MVMGSKGYLKTAILIVFLVFNLVALKSVYASQGDIYTMAGTGSTLAAANGTLAAVSGLNNPGGIAVDAAGDIIVADSLNNVIRKIDPSGEISTVAGTGYAGFSGDGGPATAAQLNSPAGIYIDGTGSIYCADKNNNRIRKIDASGTITTVAGNGSPRYAGDGKQAVRASINLPEGVTLDTSGNMYIADTGNSRIRKVNAQGTMSTFAGSSAAGFSGDGGAAVKAELNCPEGVALDNLGNLYIADTNNNRVRVINANGIIKTAAGNGSAAYSGDGGQAVSASLNKPASVLFSKGALIIGDTANSAVRTVDSSGVIGALAGNGTAGCSGDFGPAVDASLNHPVGIVADAKGNLYISDSLNNRVRMMEGPSYVLPIAEITAPLSGGSVSGSITVTGAASGANGVAYVEVSTDCGATWDTASGTSSWSYNWTPPVSGNFYIISRATDSLGVKGNILGCELVSVSTSAIPAPAYTVNTATTTTSTGPVGYWKFDETSGATATDSSGLGNTGTLNGAVRVSGVSGNAVSFDGTGTYVVVPGTASLKPASTVSVTAWVKTSTAPAAGGEVVSMGDNYVLRVLTDGNVLFFYYNGTAWITVQTTGVNILDGQWHHLAGVKSASQLQIFVDGVSKAAYSTTGSIPYTLGANLYVGIHGNGSTAHNFNGVIDEVRIYNRDLSASEVQTIYSSITPSVSPISASLTANPATATAGATVTWTASASGGSGSYQYEFMRMGPDTGGTYVVAQSYGTSNTWAWATTSAMAGTNTIMVYVKNSDGTGQVTSTAPAYTVSPVVVNPIVVNSLTPSVASPQTTGASVTWTASASGGSGTYQYQFSRTGPDTGGTAVVAQAWGTSNKWTWATTSSMAGTNTITVSVRNSDGTGTVSQSATYTIASTTGTSSNQATLTLSASTSANLAGYNVYVGTASGNYTQKFKAGNVTTYTASNLLSGKTYYFAVTSYDSSGNESPYSNEMSKAIP